MLTSGRTGSEVKSAEKEHLFDDINQPRRALSAQD